MFLCVIYLLVPSIHPTINILCLLTSMNTCIAIFTNICILSFRVVVAVFRSTYQHTYTLIICFTPYALNSHYSPFRSLTLLLARYEHTLHNLLMESTFNGCRQTACMSTLLFTSIRMNSYLGMLVATRYGRKMYTYLY